MNTRCAGRLCFFASSLIALACGCASPQPQRRQEAEQRWSAARARVKVKLAADQLAAGNLVAAESEVAEAQRLDPANAELVPLQARLWLAEGQVTRAEELLARTELDGPAQAEIEYLRGVALQQQQRWDDALAAFLRAAAIDPNEIAYVTAAVQARLQLSQPDEALGYLTTAASRLAWTPAYQAALAETHEQLGDWSAAAAAWQQVARGTSADADIRERLAGALYRAGRFNEAIPLLTPLLDESDDDSANRLRLMLAECLLADGQTARACEQAQVVVGRERDNVQALRLLARAHAAAGDFERALRIAQQALAASARDVRTLELVAALASRTQNGPLAESTARRLLEIDPDNAVARHVQTESNSIRDGAPN